ncbi:hypothetical protein ABEW34_07435 [Paenibacillus algorifonticola]|uniref:hypothetical protein n=1 Tax=Paenibacillus algorifonticola TaxID=684063 RepID=UPI003D2CD6A0
MEEYDTLSESLKALDTILSNDPLNKEMLWRVVDNFFKHSRESSYLSASIDTVFSKPSGSVIEFLLQDINLSKNVLQDLQSEHELFYLALCASFADVFKRHCMKQMNKDYLEMMFWSDDSTLKLIKADGDYLDIHTDTSTLIFISKKIYAALINRIETLEPFDADIIETQIIDLYNSLQGVVQYLKNRESEVEGGPDE